MSIEWTEYFRNIAEEVKTKSKDINTKIGVVIIGPDHEIRSTGYNSFPRGIDDNIPERQERPEKYFWFAHAERNAIYNAARVGISTNGCTMYCTCGIPCTGCAIAIIQSGIKEVWCTRESDSEKWKEEAKRSIRMFIEAGIKVRYYT